MRWLCELSLSILIAPTLLLGVASNGSAQSPNPTSLPSEVGQAQPNQNNAQTAKPSPSQIPTVKLSVPQASPDKIESKQDTENGGSSSKPPTHDTFWAEWVMAGAAVVYSFFAILQWCALRRTVKETQSLVMTTKQQTSLIEQTLLLNQRPRIKVRSVSWVRDYGADKGILTFHLKIANYGGVAARIGDTNFTVYSKAMQAIELPVEPSYKDGYNLIEVPNDLLEAGTSQLVIISYPRELNDWDREAITHGGFYIIGYIKYAGDVKGIRYETAFCRNYSQERGRYLPITNDEYEYED